MPSTYGRRPLLARRAIILATERKSDPLRPPAGAAIVLTVLVPFGCGFYLSYLFRTVNGVISPHLRSEFGLDAEGLGFLTGIYFATFAAMQPVLGVAHLLQVVAFVWMIRRAAPQGEGLARADVEDIPRNGEAPGRVKGVPIDAAQLSRPTLCRRRNRGVPR